MEGKVEWQRSGQVSSSKMYFPVTLLRHDVDVQEAGSNLMLLAQVTTVVHNSAPLRDR